MLILSTFTPPAVFAGRKVRQAFDDERVARTGKAEAIFDSVNVRSRLSPGVEAQSLRREDAGLAISIPVNRSRHAEMTMHAVSRMLNLHALLILSASRLRSCRDGDLATFTAPSVWRAVNVDQDLDDEGAYLIRKVEAVFQFCKGRVNVEARGPQAEATF